MRTTCATDSEQQESLMVVFDVSINLTATWSGIIECLGQMLAAQLCRLPKRIFGLAINVALAAQCLCCRW